MNALATAILPLLLLASTLPFIPAAEATTAPIRFGMDAGSVEAQRYAGVAPTYGTIWIGPWTLTSGWSGPDAQLAKLKQAGVTPVIHYYYWGNDISKSCIQDGCWSESHNAWKSREKWQRLAVQLADHLEAKMGGEPVAIVLETEFNKNDVQYSENLDYLLSQKAAYFDREYPAGKVVLGFGNWNSGAWGTFDRAAAASDYVGLQGMRASTRDTATSYGQLYEAVLAGAKTAKSLFGKPIFVTDLALSSYPEPDYKWKQASALKEFFTGMDNLRAAGVKAIVYRAWYDSNTNTADYYGKAEAHWGLDWGTSSGYKPAGQVWVEGVKAERGTATSTTSSTSSTFTASFTPKAVGNNWWVESSVKSSTSVTKVEAKVNGGTWTTLPKTDWGTYAKSINAPNGSSVVFRATASSGATATSSTYTWT